MVHICNHSTQDAETGLKVVNCVHFVLSLKAWPWPGCSGGPRVTVLILPMAVCFLILLVASGHFSAGSMIITETTEETKKSKHYPLMLGSSTKDTLAIFRVPIQQSEVEEVTYVL